MNDAHYPGSPSKAPTGVLRFLFFFLPVVAAALAGCGSDPVRQAAPTPPQRHWATVAPADPAAANAVLMRAISLVGTP